MSEQETEQSVGTPTHCDEASTMEACQKALAECQQASTQYREALLRARADLDNYVKRSTRELENARKYAVANLLEALVPVKDSLELGVAADYQADFESIRQGLVLTLEMFESVLSEYGVETLDPQGQPFDPEQHEAIRMVALPELPPNSVAQVLQKGYRLNGRVIRPARVTVSKSPSIS